MLKETFGDGQTNRTVVRKLSHRPRDWPISMTCHICPDFKRCGGIATEAGAGDCGIHCCGGKCDCQSVCRRNPSFKAQLREIRGFELDTVPRTQPLENPALSGVAPLILHGKKRSDIARASMVALKLRDVINIKTGALRYPTRSALADALKFDTAARLIITGIEQDKWVEPWWNLGRAARARTLQDLARLGAAVATPPNFSLFCDQPRTNDFSAMKRIALVQAEFLAAGIPCALHPHIRNENDSDDWAKFIAVRPEINVISYEFKTGAGRALDVDLHIQHLTRLAETAKTSLSLVVRGDVRILPRLAPHYRNIVYIDTNAFMKAIHRRMAVRSGNLDMNWDSVRTPEQISLDALMQHNIDEVVVRASHFLARAA